MCYCQCAIDTVILLLLSLPLHIFEHPLVYANAMLLNCYKVKLLQGYNVTMLH